MIWIVIAIQLTLSAGLLWAAWQVWMFKKALIATVKTVDGWTKACQNGLQVSSPSLEIARDNVGALRDQYQKLQMQLERIQKLLSVLGRGVSFLGSRWQKSGKGTPNSLNHKSSNRSSGSRSSGSKHNVKRRR
ncbi:MAG: hypothetical protein ACK5EU_03500 [Pseudanabaena sp.]|jgi:hypothetical protein|uniref:hypothetical protein n=1 Tax=Pseudanabaena mucicola TaxID=71190 RepID=UPI0025765A0A|nr:hypothetical protein [Pseudanabaena mucicola]MCA6572413.1 hypothetical protein [Pseudanabaena sp. M53BS1SP1A06MG]MCA6578106.1 hypothetical protein [Pseudanabaena sp. M085S1SP2A07QC]MCA6587228.1 hypothetical protein [Pseudanabaena sp. M051S1SP1A06QC]MCA6589146.1 hypothetical protein [Pseudanabaena sp. M109S1SP1A06QC]MCA6591721.1 hypothetical protein [Pseudanabaena sp. M38BS1SP1A06MG]MCA6595143.1 hypothetical protein [Pseudanabaena sp. M046S1SP1A06QC]MCA6601017.1 hypothetical protein [Pseud